MPADELAAWLRLTLTPGVGNEAARRLLGRFGMPQQVFAQNTANLHGLVTPAQAKALQEPVAQLPALVATTQAWLAAAPGHHLLTLADTDYPASLLECSDPPLMLYMLADDRARALQAMTDVNQSLAMVGSRNPTAQGLATARHFAQDLAGTGVHIVSGMALGVDGAAHEGSLAARAALGASAGATLAVVGTGLDRVYPRQHRELAHRIAQQGAILSEFPLGTPPLSQNFPKRNRIIAALSRATLVVEAALQSGSLITARCALEMGKDVLAIPGSIHSPQSRGCHALIKQGAKLVETAQDVLEELQLRPSMVVTKLTASQASRTPANRPSDWVDPPEGDDALAQAPGLASESPLLSALGFAPTALDALVDRTGQDAATLQAQLMALELDGWVARLPGGLYQRLAIA